jgi:hypothetical protein
LTPAGRPTVDQLQLEPTQAARNLQVPAVPVLAKKEYLGWLPAGHCPDAAAVR